MSSTFFFQYPVIVRSVTALTLQCIRLSQLSRQNTHIRSHTSRHLGDAIMQVEGTRSSKKRRRMADTGNAAENHGGEPRRSKRMSAAPIRSADYQSLSGEAASPTTRELQWCAVHHCRITHRVVLPAAWSQMMRSSWP